MQLVLVIDLFGTCLTLFPQFCMTIHHSLENQFYRTTVSPHLGSKMVMVWEEAVMWRTFAVSIP